jgi:membrane protein implicated in regulation of membrane protease activity
MDRVTIICIVLLILCVIFLLVWLFSEDAWWAKWAAVAFGVLFVVGLIRLGIERLRNPPNVNSEQNYNDEQSVNYQFADAYGPDGLSNPTMYQPSWQAS